MASRSEGPLINGWQLACCAVAVPIVYCFEQQFFEAVVVLSLLMIKVAYGGFHWFAQFPQAAIDLASQSQGSLLAALGTFVLMLVGVIVGVVVGLFVLACILVLAIPAYVGWWLATTPGPVRYLLDLILVWYVGLFLYGLLFPIVWRMVEPLIAMTLGEFTFQRIRARVYGVRPRFTQPLYLSVAVVGLVGGSARVLAPVGSAAAADVSSGWHQVSDPVFRPTPPEWPKVFDVAPGQIVWTYVALGPQEEVDYDSTGFVTAIVAGTITPAFKPRVGTTRSVGSTAPASQLSFQGGATGARVTINGPPHPTARRWLATGESYMSNTPWLDEGDWIRPCTGPNLQYRLRSSHGSTRWQPLNNWGNCSDPNPQGNLVAQTAGRFEVRAASPSWIENVTTVRETRYVWLVPNPDTGIAFRRGDRFRVTATGSELKLLNDGTKIPAYATRDLMAAWNGTLKLRPTNPWYNRADVTILDRGPDWK